ncbi:hypothetical protein FRC17_002215 [Serendipita sp. 399]|nr:hypothetical protein FRC17_002215 [Serendipita sp. 399]
MSQALKERTVEDYYYFVEYQTQWSDNDQYGHLNNSVYNHLIDTVVNKYLIDHAGLDVKGETRSGNTSIGLVVESHAAFFRSLSFPSRILLALRVELIGRSSVRYEVGVFGPIREEGSFSTPPLPSTSTPNPSSSWSIRLTTPEPAMVGGFTHVFVDEKSRRPVKELPSSLHSGLAAIHDEKESSRRENLAPAKL